MEEENKSQREKNSAQQPLQSKETEQQQEKEQQGAMPHEVMVLEDDQVTRKMITAILGKKGFRVVAAKNGREALSKLDTWHPDVFIVDMNMPVMNGVDFLHEIRKEKDFLKIPVIILTAQRDKNSIMKVANLGIDSYIAKPVNFSLLEKKIKEVGQTDALVRRLKNLKSIHTKQITQLDLQHRQLMQQLKIKEKQFLDFQKKFKENIGQYKNKMSENGEHKINSELESLKKKLTRHQADFLTVKSKYDQALNGIEIEKNRLQADLTSMDDLLEKINPGRQESSNQ